MLEIAGGILIAVAVLVALGVARAFFMGEYDRPVYTPQPRQLTLEERIAEEIEARICGVLVALTVIGAPLLYWLNGGQF